jgi:hypothetical protein
MNIDYKKQSDDIVQMIVLAAGSNSITEIALKVEERIRKIAHVERGFGYRDRMYEERSRHEILRAQIDAALSEMRR